MIDLCGKVAAVTGAGSGIGRGIALELARAGADVHCADVAEGRAKETAQQVASLGRRASVSRTDVRSRSDCSEMVSAAVAEHARLDIAVANAGIARGNSVLFMSEEDWDVQTDVNLKGVFLTVQACAREMVRQGRGGRIVTIASLAAERPNPGSFGYCATKAGVRMMSRCFALDLAPFGITVNCIGPGIIDTPLAAPLIGEGAQREATAACVPLGRLGDPSDIGRLACWLASDEAEYLTGTYQLIDGGLADKDGFGLPLGRQAELLNFVRQRREQVNGAELLAELDAMMAQAREVLEQDRKSRGLL